jgi:uncharacterized integral membrane protein
MNTSKKVFLSLIFGCGVILGIALAGIMGAILTVLVGMTVLAIRKILKRKNS